MASLFRRLLNAGESQICTNQSASHRNGHKLCYAHHPEFMMMSSERHRISAQAVKAYRRLPIELRKLHSCLLVSITIRLTKAGNTSAGLQ